MSHRKVPLWLASAGAALLVVGSGCTDVGLYEQRINPYEEDILTVSGNVCSDDPRQRNFPVKVLFLVDTSQPLTDEANDPVGFRGKAVRDVVELWGKFSNYSFGIIDYGALVTNRIEGGFTRNTSLLNAQTEAIQGSSGACQGGSCRNIRGALSLASSLITGDILASDPGEVARTSYVLVMFANGPPVPAVGRCSCRNPDDEPIHWPSCGWSECEGCDVTCPPRSICDGTQCYPICDPPCRRGRWCLPDRTTCIRAGDVPSRPVVTPENVNPVSIPDTFTQWVLPVDVTPFGLDPSLITGSPCDQACIYPAGGRADSCEERELVGAVREMREFALGNGAAQFQFHTTYLPDRAPHVDGSLFKAPACTCLDGSDCSAEANEARTIRLLSEMAFGGGGGFLQFNNAETISYRHVDLFTAREPLVVKELVVSNANVLPGIDDLEIDSDQDGLSDETEQLLGTCDVDPDTDGDGLNDALELKLAQNPLQADDPVECIDLEPATREDEDLCASAGSATKSWKLYEDRDGDTLNSCEERLLGTQDSLYDSDADGIPDRVEFRAGTNYLAVDPLADADLDGILNREEVRGHSDPRANDAQKQLDLSYRYQEVDEGIRTVISVSQPPTITGVNIRTVSAESTQGVGTLRFEPGPPPTLAWQGPGDSGPGGDFGEAVDVSRPTTDGFRLSSQNGNFIDILAEGPAYYPPIAAQDRIVVSGAKRNCLRFRVRNIKLMETKEAWFTSPRGPFRSKQGDNTVYMYFAEAPGEAKDGYGIFRVASVVLNFREGENGDPPVRTPRAAELTFTDDDFILFE
jgi:hypothetical protein